MAWRLDFRARMYLSPCRRARSLGAGALGAGARMEQAADDASMHVLGSLVCRLVGWDDGQGGVRREEEWF